MDEFSSEDIEQRRYSTLDLCDFDKFTLIGNLEVPGVKTCTLGKDFEVIGSAGKEWLKGTGLNDGGGLLIRPDQHILMVLEKDTTAEDVELRLRQHLGI